MAVPEVGKFVVCIVMSGKQTKSLTDFHNRYNSDCQVSNINWFKEDVKLPHRIMNSNNKARKPNNELC